MRLAGRRVLISGAASGIGRATAALFRAEGAAVALLDRDGAALSAAAEALAADAGPAVARLEADVADGAAVGRAVEQGAAAIGGLDGVVAAAGIDCLKPFEAMTPEDWHSTLAVNLTGPFHLCYATVPYLRRAGRGTIVQIASGAALRPLPARSAYCAAKAGQVMFAKALAVDLAPIGVRVNAICPGIVDTPLFRRSYETAEDPNAELERILDRYLIRRVGRPEDIAQAALYLTSDESAHVTGTSLSVDGGRSFH